jgi:hypothetical protein
MCIISQAANLAETFAHRTTKLRYCQHLSLRLPGEWGPRRRRHSRPVGPNRRSAGTRLAPAVIESPSGRRHQKTSPILTRRRRRRCGGAVGMPPVFHYPQVLIVIMLHGPSSGIKLIKTSRLTRDAAFGIGKIRTGYVQKYGAVLGRPPNKPQVSTYRPISASPGGRSGRRCCLVTHFGNMTRFGRA